MRVPKDNRALERSVIVNTYPKLFYMGILFCKILRKYENMVYCKQVKLKSIRLKLKGG